ncbi:hypothetical protein [Bdellovibrio svalbardensis]|uniref:Uncharacterized protein n=1 Tax=Bdellovibrio svalbardensis TaxID=2972972 RepID=A0ABT6DLW9_9BACT|nr:hypothetical protein [Bdellovibrio svalbardensis]MDG0817798.1 hypothetical protein [Bdellovibrio svalbardensis]
MKALVSLSILILFITSQALAANDSLGVFFRPEKTIIQITQGGIQSRLQKWLKYVGAKQDAQLLSSDNSFKMECVRDLDTARCQLRLLPSALVQFHNKKIQAHIPLKDLGLSDAGPIEVPFESANGDRLDLVVSDGTLHLYVSKAR